ncbi:hypothetical protein [Ferruginibacter sp. SUN106]|uniref:hypothetical protein n=1 Tax=Ferruginibacter sp. SUN106 TaxID=2978348 RepID=UPI003D35FEC1
MKFSLLIIAVLSATLCNAQDCTPQSLIQKNGSWKESPKGSEGGTAAELVKEKKIVAAMHAMIKTKYSPMGVQANFHGAYNRPYSNMPANSYYYNIMPLNFYCNGTTVKVADETSSYFQLGVNMFEAEIYDTAQGDRLLMECFNVMPDIPIKKDGYWYFGEIDANLGFGMTGKSSMWLITYDDKLPYAYVTRKEFLEKRIKAITAMQEMAAGGYKDALKNIDIEKSFKEKEFKNDPAKMEQYMKKEYGVQKTKYEKLLAENQKTYAPAFAAIETQLTMPAAELEQPAIVKIDPKSTFNYLFTTDDDPFGKVLIKPNPGYFNKKLPRSVPQFFCVYVRANHKEPIAAKFYTDIIKAVDFNLLKNMLGK